MGNEETNLTESIAEMEIRSRHETGQLELPGLDLPIGEFAEVLIEVLQDRFEKSNSPFLFYRAESQEAVYIGIVGVSSRRGAAQEMILGFKPVDPKGMGSYLESHGLNFGVLQEEKRGFSFRRKTLPTNTAAMLLAAEKQFLQKLPRIAEIRHIPTPYLRDKKLVYPKVGYDFVLQTWMDESTVRIHPMPLEDAKRLLTQIYAEFCFEREQDAINAIAALLTAYTRTLLPKTTTRTPLFIYLGNREGCGKDYCAGITGLIMEGKDIQDAPPREHGDGDDELRKHVVANLLLGRQRMHLANVKGSLESPILEWLLTNEEIPHRKLGTERILLIPNTSDYSLSGNLGIVYSADLARRSISVRFHYAGEDINSRVFRNPDLHGWILENRADIVSALAALVQHWYDSGMPKCSQPFAAFPQWMAIVGGIMEAAGWPAPKSNLVADGVSGDRETQSMRELISVGYTLWPETQVSKKDLFSALQNSEGPFADILNWIDSPTTRGWETKVGRLLTRWDRRVANGYYLVIVRPSDKSSASRNRYLFTRTKPDSAKISIFLENKQGLDLKVDTDLLSEEPPKCQPMSTFPIFSENNNNKITPIVPKADKADKDDIILPNSTSPSSPLPELRRPGPECGEDPLDATKNEPDADNKVLAAVRAAVRKAEELKIPLDPYNPHSELAGYLSGLYSEVIKDTLDTMIDRHELLEIRPNVFRLTKS